jgi:hypothetical protein
MVGTTLPLCPLALSSGIRLIDYVPQARTTIPQWCTKGNAADPEGSTAL